MQSISVRVFRQLKSARGGPQKQKAVKCRWFSAYFRNARLRRGASGPPWCRHFGNRQGHLRHF